MDDKILLKLFEAGLGVDAVSRHLNLAHSAVSLRVAEYVRNGILLCKGEKEQVDWRAFGEWSRGQRTPQPA